jgi:L-asparagine transporter-like permease
MAHPGHVAVTLVRIAAVYLLVSLAIGMYMAMTHNHALATVHSHVALLGWATMAVTGLVYLLLPACGGNRLAAAHFWLHNLGLPVMLAALMVLILTGDERAEPVIGIGSVLVAAALVCFTVNVFRRAAAAPAGGTDR